MNAKKTNPVTKETAFALMPGDNDAFYITENAPSQIFCSECGCIIDESYRPTSIELRTRKDVSFTLDGRIILSQAAKTFLDSLHIDGLMTRPLATRGATMYLLDTTAVVAFDTSRRPVVFEGKCGTCGQYLDVYHALPVYLKSKDEVRPMMLAKTDLISGYKDRKSPIFLVGSELMKAMKSSGLTGLAFDPVRE